MIALSRSQRVLVLVAAAATSALGLALAAGWEPGLRGEWVWRRNTLPTNLWLGLVAALWLTALSAFLCRPRAWEQLRPAGRAISLAALLLGVFVLQLALLNAVGLPWVTPGAYIVSPSATTYFNVALEVDNPREWIRQYPDLVRTLPYHAATHPPGFVLFFLGVQRMCAALLSQPSPWVAELATSYNDLFGLGLSPTDAAAAIVSAALIALLGALALIPLYLLACRLAGPGTAICSTCLAAAMPGLLLLGASPDLIVFAVAVTTLCLGYCAWQRQSLLLGALAGIALALGLFFTIGFALIAAWAMVWLVFGVFTSDDRGVAIRRAVAVGGLGVGGFVVFYLALGLVFGYRPIAVALEGLAVHRDITTVEGARTYWKWVLVNPVECAMFAGLPLTVATLFSIRAPADQGQARLRAFLLSWLVLFVVLDLTGAVRGEVGRIWVFLYWPLALAAGAAVSRFEHTRARTVALLVLLQTVQVLMMKSYLTMYSIL
jgi:hypothetical protein